MKKLLALALCALTLVFACAAAMADASITFQMGGEPECMDPTINDYSSGSYALQSLFRGLYKYDADGALVPAMAESYEVSEDGCTYTFKLKEGLKWSDGSPLTAHDFEYSWKRVLNPEVGSETAYTLYGVIKDGYECFVNKTVSVDDLPDSADSQTGAQDGASVPQQSAGLTWLWVLLGVIALYVLAILGVLAFCARPWGASVALLALSIAVMALGWIPLCGLKVLKPQEALVLTLFGKYVGTLTEGDILWGLKKYHGLDLEAAEDVPISAFPHKRDYKAVTVTTSMDQLIEAAMNQNFVPVVDDRGSFIGIVRRQAIIRYCYEKSREEKAPQPGRVVPEYAAAH